MKAYPLGFRSFRGDRRIRVAVKKGNEYFQLVDEGYYPKVYVVVEKNQTRKIVDRLEKIFGEYLAELPLIRENVRLIGEVGKFDLITLALENPVYKNLIVSSLMGDPSIKTVLPSLVPGSSIDEYVFERKHVPLLLTNYKLFDGNKFKEFEQFNQKIDNLTSIAVDIEAMSERGFPVWDEKKATSKAHIICIGMVGDNLKKIIVPPPFKFKLKPKEWEVMLFDAIEECKLPKEAKILLRNSVEIAEDEGEAIEKAWEVIKRYDKAFFHYGRGFDLGAFYKRKKGKLMDRFGNPVDFHVHELNISLATPIPFLKDTLYALKHFTEGGRDLTRVARTFNLPIPKKTSYHDFLYWLSDDFIKNERITEPTKAMKILFHCLSDCGSTLYLGKFFDSELGFEDFAVKYGLLPTDPYIPASEILGKKLIARRLFERGILPSSLEGTTNLPKSKLYRFEKVLVREKLLKGHWIYLKYGFPDFYSEIKIGDLKLSEFLKEFAPSELILHDKNYPFGANQYNLPLRAVMHGLLFGDSFWTNSKLASQIHKKLSKAFEQVEKILIKGVKSYEGEIGYLDLNKTFVALPSKSIFRLIDELNFLLPNLVLGVNLTQDSFFGLKLGYVATESGRLIRRNLRYERRKRPPIVNMLIKKTAEELLRNGKEAASRCFKEINHKIENKDYPLDYYKFFVFLTQHPDEYEKKSDPLIELTKKAIRFYEEATGKRYKPFTTLTYYLLKKGKFAVWDEDEKCFLIGRRRERIRKSKRISLDDLDLKAYVQIALKEAPRMFRGIGCLS